MTSKTSQAGKLRRNEALSRTDWANWNGSSRKLAWARLKTSIVSGRKAVSAYSCARSWDWTGRRLAFDTFMEGRQLTAPQVEFVNMVIDYLTERGVMDPRLVYESPFTDLDLLGAAGLFKEREVAPLIEILRGVQGGARRSGRRAAPSACRRRRRFSTVIRSCSGPLPQSANTAKKFAANSRARVDDE